MKTFPMTDTGLQRKENEDYYFASDVELGNLPNLFIVADGMGGHNAGEYASKYTVERVVASILKSSQTEPVSLIKEAIEKANSLLLEESRSNESRRGMGTTLVCATIVGHKMYVANVGDSRLYIINRQIVQVTRDHSLVEEMVRTGKVKINDAKHHPDKNVITRAVGVVEDIAIDFFEVELDDNDIVLLCSDGLTNMVDDEDIKNIICSHDSGEEQISTLIGFANQNGGKDNITAIIIKPFSDEVKKC
ncbi:Stp1/IreP family PP2C-type Ser/Thr phosphatase [Lachnobacterium bovis]|uniref:Protein phosphatase n=1 Tax=Lachnobacterium bovis DSM 14045 TaxID=1122142 RepID=A0A1H3MN85_9FIRM|nr:Stp1/IreP family PP2C-type Ser/Thr phosphatase [Lachnobacterium bovis]SDY77645.1 protein phosphatase [Lachnobacterium bovis DSM 14045]